VNKTPAWFTVQLQFLADTDQDTVDMVLQRAIGVQHVSHREIVRDGVRQKAVRVPDRLNMELVTTDGQVRAVRLSDANTPNDNFMEEFETDGAEYASMMTFALCHEDTCEPTGEYIQVRYSEIVSLGVY
jgi:hypothetical protein